MSPNGEARELVNQKKLSHTSMSVGDVLEIGDDFFIVEQAGFGRIWNKKEKP